MAAPFNNGTQSSSSRTVLPLPPLHTASSAKRRCTSVLTGPPQLPTYLQHTLYAALAREQHEQTQSKSKWTGREQPDLRLPSAWNRHDKSRHLEVENGGLDLVYTGPGKTETHAASVRSNFPIRRQCGIYYYEMRVVSKGEEGFIGMGFCSGKNGLDRLPGWDSDSWGYHGDDGHSFEESGTGKTYGPRFTTGDIIGCGINMANKTAFYTKNGTYLGVAFKSLKTSMSLYPCVGLRTVGEHVTVNFGQDPFVFDIVHYVEEQKHQVYNQASVTQEGEEDKVDSGEVMDRLVLSYLVYQGYMGTAKAALSNMKHASGRSLELSHSGTEKVDDKEEEDMYKRQGIRSAVLQGNIDLAIQLAQSYFPECMEKENLVAHDIMFELKARKFVEMVREYSLHVHQQQLRSPSLSSTDDDMDIDQGSARKKRSRTSGNGFMDSGLVLSDEEAKDVLLERIMNYGQQLRSEYHDDSRPEVEARLKEIFSLLAYSDPSSGRMAYLLDTSKREELATKINSVMLILQHRPEEPPLERIYRQAVVTNRQLACMGHGRSLLLPDLADPQWF
ncbi:concanavalin A-like lectin/glucanase domain-containing protein [Fennellomyces sp. T-0311]|nr:concanavalin A-like lectin/glucanase domain-containing protein [Fennellomyces sp. T-0311]